MVVTGAAGFIGSRLLEAWTRHLPPEKLLAVDHPLVAAKTENLSVAPEVGFMDHQAFLAALEQGRLNPELILHMGACSATTESNWGYLLANNVEYSQRIWSWCATHSARIIYASSAATYGDGTLGFNDEEDITQLKPLNLYGRSKQDFDLWVQARTAGPEPRPAQSVGLKFFNVFGPGEGHKGRMASMVFHGYHQIQEQGSVRLFKSHRRGYEDGGQLRDFIYVGDVVRAIAALAARPTVNGLFNLGTGRAKSFRELIEALFFALKREPRIDYISMPDDLQGKYQYFTEATMRKLAAAGISYAPITLEAAMSDYVSWLDRTIPSR